MSEERGCLQAKTGAHGTILMLKYGHKPQKLTVITTTCSRKEAWKTQAAGMVEGQGGASLSSGAKATQLETLAKENKQYKLPKLHNSNDCKVAFKMHRPACPIAFSLSY